MLDPLFIHATIVTRYCSTEHAEHLLHLLSTCFEELYHRLPPSMLATVSHTILVILANIIIEKYTTELLEIHVFLKRLLFVSLFGLESFIGKVSIAGTTLKRVFWSPEVDMRVYR